MVELVRDAGDGDPSCFVVVGCWDDFDDFVAGEVEAGYVRGVACHEVAVQHAQDGFVCDEK